MNKQVSLVVDAVAEDLGGTWGKNGESHDAEIKVGGKRFLLDAIALKPHRKGVRRIRLRFDKVVVRLMEHLQNHLAETVLEGNLVLLTLTAPIRLPAKTAVALQDKIQTVGERRSTKATIYGNRVQIRILKHGSPDVPKLLGFVHNPDSDPGALLKMTADLVELIRHHTSKATRSRAVERALILVDSEGISDIAAYRYICSQLHLATVFQKIFVVWDNRQVETLPE